MVEAAIERNPRVLQARSDYLAANHRIAQVTALPDPTVGVTWHAHRPETRTGPQRKSLSVSQKLPWPGKRSERGQVAASDAQASDAAVRARQAEVVRGIKLAYYDLAYLDQALVIAAERELLLRHYESLAQARYAQGIGPQQAAVRLQAEITRVLNRRQILLRQRLEANATLNLLRDHPADERLPAVVLGERPVVSVDGVGLQERAPRQRAEVKIAQLRMQGDAGRVRLARREYWPDLVVGASWGDVGGRRDTLGREAPPPDNGKDVFSLTLGVDIPLYRGKYDAGVQEADARLAAAREAYRDVINDVRLAVHTATLRLDALNEQLALFENALLPQAEQALHLAEAAYSTGAVQIVDLLDSEQVLFDVRLGLARLNSDFMKALADMERAVGSPFPEERS